MVVIGFGSGVSPYIRNTVTCILISDCSRNRQHSVRGPASGLKSIYFHTSWCGSDCVRLSNPYSIRRRFRLISRVKCGTGCSVSNHLDSNLHSSFHFLANQQESNCVVSSHSTRLTRVIGDGHTFWCDSYHVLLSFDSVKRTFRLTLAYLEPSFIHSLPS